MKTDDMVIELGNRILRLRQKLNISQTDLAERSDLSKTYLGEFERGQRTNISISALARIADSLGITMSELFEDIEASDEVWESDDDFARVLYQKKLEDSCYPPGLEGFSVTTLLQFLVYLPLLQPQYILDSLIRIAGSFGGDESYVLKQINHCISKIPDSDARKYADNCAKKLSREMYLRNKQDCCLELEPEEGYDEYIAKIKQIDTFFRCYRMMKESGI